MAFPQEASRLSWLTTSGQASPETTSDTTKGRRTCAILMKNPKTPKEPLHDMTTEVKNWIERAQSIMNHQKGEIERLKAEITELKAYKKWAEHRILRSDHES